MLSVYVTPEMQRFNTGAFIVIPQWGVMQNMDDFDVSQADAGLFRARANGLYQIGWNINTTKELNPGDHISVRLDSIQHGVIALYDYNAVGAETGEATFRNGNTVLHNMIAGEQLRLRIRVESSLPTFQIYGGGAGRTTLKVLKLQ